MTRRQAICILLILLDLAALLALVAPPAATAQDGGTVPPAIGQPWSELPTPTPPGPMYVCGGGRCWVQWPSVLYLATISH